MKSFIVLSAMAAFALANPSLPPGYTLVHYGAPTGPDGRVVDTPEVARAKVEHAAAYYAAINPAPVSVYRYGYNSAPIGNYDSPEIARAKIQHSLAHVNERATLATEAARGVHIAPVGFSRSGYGAPVGEDGRVVDTPEVARAKVAHTIAWNEAANPRPPPPVPVKVYQYKYDKAPLREPPVNVVKHVEDSPAVAQAKAYHAVATAQHLLAHANAGVTHAIEAARDPGNGYGYGAPVQRIYDSPAVSQAKSYHAHLTEQHFLAHANARAIHADATAQHLRAHARERANHDNVAAQHLRAYANEGVTHGNGYGAPIGEDEGANSTPTSVYQIENAGDPITVYQYGHNEAPPVKRVSDSPAVARAKARHAHITAEHALAHVNERATLAVEGARGVHVAPVGVSRSGYGAPVGKDGRVVDTPEVARAKVENAIAHVNERATLANVAARLYPPYNPYAAYYAPYESADVSEW